MSHLTTVINRVKSRADQNDMSMMFEQAVINLMEYLAAWHDYKKSERAEAIELFGKYNGKFEGNLAPSHRARLASARAYFNSIKK